MSRRCRNRWCSEKVFVSQKRVSGFPEKRLTSGEVRGTSGEVWGTSGEVRGTSGEVRGTSGEVWETSGEPLDCYSVPQWENFRGSRRKHSGEVRGTSGEVRGLSRSSGEPDSLPVTRQICLLQNAFKNPALGFPGVKDQFKGPGVL